MLKKNLVDPGAIIFSPLHIMLGLMTQFFKTLVKLAQAKEKQNKLDAAKKKKKRTEGEENDEEEEGEENEEEEEDEDDDHYEEEEEEVC